MAHKKRKSWFLCFAQSTARWTGSPFVFVMALITVIVWGVTGPAFHYSDTWQLVINTSTTIITFLMVFLIQNTQNRDSKAMQLKLDELIRSSEGAHTSLLDLEELNEEELEAFARKYRSIAEVAREKLRAGQSDTDIPDIILDKPLEIEKQTKA